ncbi:hypothetical protein PUR21_06155 [Methylorubrum rhodesianum]|jgi:hypothetical protein|nr:hypothetical protein [Methylorubrum extorquens]MRI57828.1 hypothetical protein [Methylobacterium sp. DB1607]
MATLRLNEWRRWTMRLRRARPTLPMWNGNTVLLIDSLLSASLCVGLALLLPSPAMPTGLAALLSLTGFVWLGVAIARACPPFGSGHLTAWDAALLCFGSSFCVQSAARLGAFGP